MRFTLTLLILILILGCNNENQSLLLNPKSIKYHNESIDFDYSIKKVFNYDSNTHIGQIEYFKNEKLIERILDESHYQYFYDYDSKLIKINECRFNNCNVINWELMKYDGNGNLIGSFRTRDSIVNIEKVNVLQNRFYNSQNQLIKELVRNSDKLWKTYTYENNRIDEVYKINETDTLLFSKYSYNDSNQLKRIERKKDSTYIIELYEYDNGNISKKILESNQYPLNDNVKFSANNSTTEYYYNNENKLIKEVVFDHRGKQYQLIEYQIERKSTNGNNVYKK